MTGPAVRPHELGDDALAGYLSEAWAVQPEPARARAARSRAVGVFGIAGRRYPRRLPLTIAACAAGLAIGYAVATATQDALPGDAGYAPRLALEEVDVALAGDALTEADAWLVVAEHRVEDAVRAEAAGRFDTLPEILRRYQEAVDLARARLADAPPGTSTDRARAAAERELGTHLEVLTALLSVTPPQAHDGLARAIEAARGAAPAGPPVSGPPGPGPGR